MPPVLARFVLEARRRGLLKVATAYLIVSWLVLEIGHTLFLIFDLPHGALQFIFALLALGFPVVLLGVWQGWLGASAPLTEGAPGEAHASAHHDGPWLAVVFGAVALFAVAVAIGVRFFGMGGSGSSHVTHSQAAVPLSVTTAPAATVTPPAFNPPAHSIAVLPLVNISGDAGNEAAVSCRLRTELDWRARPRRNRVGKSLHLAIVGIGMPDTAVTFYKADRDGDCFYDVEIEATAAAQEVELRDDSGEDLVYGAGVGLTFFEHLHARLEYEIIDVSEVDDANAIWLSGAWRF